MDIREVCKIARKKKGMTQKQVADEAGWSYSYYAKFEKGWNDINPTLTKLEDLAQALDVYLTMVM